MKVIVSHDVDLIAVHEHLFRDAFIPKWLVKHLLFAATRQISPGLACRRVGALAGSRLHRAPEVMELDRQFGIPSTFFVGVARGIGMSYGLRAAGQMVRLIRAQGFPVGVHGIAYEREDNVRREYARFRAMPGTEEPFGVRNHYLRFGPKTAALQAAAGYAFDSSDYGLRPPYVVDGLVEFPVCLMDSRLLRLGRNDLADVQRRTQETLEEGRRLGLPYFTIIFHDCYFADMFPVHRQWYAWLVRYLHDHHPVTDFVSAADEVKAGEAERCLACKR